MGKKKGKKKRHGGDDKQEQQVEIVNDQVEPEPKVASSSPSASASSAGNNKRKRGGRSVGGKMRQARVHAILKALESKDDSMERLEACETVVSLFEQGEALEKDMVKHFVELGGFEKLRALLEYEQDGKVRVEACSALHSISMYHGYNMCQMMVDCNLLGSVFKVLRSGTGDIETERDLRIQCLELLCNIFENADGVKWMNEEGNVELILTHLGMENDISSSAARLLHIATDGNKTLAHRFMHDREVLTRLASLITMVGQCVPTRLHLCGTLLNVSLTSQSKVNACSVILPVLGSREVLHEQCDYAKSAPIGQAELLESLDEAMEEEEEEEEEEEDDDDDEEIEKAKNIVETWLSGVEAQSLGLEILTNVCCADIDVSVERNALMPRQDDNEQHQQQEQENEDEYMGTTEEFNMALLGHARVMHVVLESGAMGRVVSVLSSTCKALEELDLPQVIVGGIVKLGQRAAGCLDNFVQNMALDSLKRSDGNRLWGLIYRVTNLVAMRQSEEELEFLESLTALSWSLLRRMEEGPNNLGLEVPVQHMEVLKRLAISPTTPVVRANSIGILGTLCKFGLERAKHNDLYVSMCAVIAACLDDASMHVVVQTLDVVFDVFGDDSNDDIYGKLNLEMKLRRLSPRVRSALEDKALRMDRDALEDASRNLIRFLLYKKENSGNIKTTNMALSS